MPRVKQFDREEVLEKAMELFWQKGFNGTSISDLVEHLGINRASLYDTYGGKESLYQEAIQLYRKINGKHFQDLETSLKKHSVRTSLEAFFTRTLRSIQNDKEKKGCMVVNATTELCNQSQHIFQFAQTNKKAFVKIMIQVIKEGQERGEISKAKNVDAIANQIVIFFNGLQVIGQIEKSPKKLKDAVELQMNYIFSG